MAKHHITKKQVTFTYDAPEAHEVRIAGDFTGWEQAAVSLKKDKTGVWKGTVSLPPGEYEYRLLVDGQWRDDPQCPDRRPNQFGSQNCIRTIDGP